MKLAYFVTGTDTEIGKTLVSTALLHSFVQRGLKSIGMKPVASGAFLQKGVWCNEDVIALHKAGNVMLPDELLGLANPYLFKLPAAPHVAARHETTRESTHDSSQIQLKKILDCYAQLQAHAEAIVVEGVGGFRVPFNDTEDSADMAQQLKLPVILVVGMRLGCINHALLTAEAIAARGLTLAGWVANSAQEEMAHLSENVAALRERLNAPVLGCIPKLETPTAAVAASYLDLNLFV